jgi:FlaA1/EpsC-like NDP-sugar epimerase
MIISTRLKILLLVTADAILIYGGQLATLFLFDQWYQNYLTPLATIIAFLIVSGISGFYRTSISHVGVGAVKKAVMAIFIGGIIIVLMKESAQFASLSSVLALLNIIGYRAVAREILFQKRRSGNVKTLVYGANSTGVQFVTASMQGHKYNVVGYIDDDKELCGSSIHGRTVFPSNKVNELVIKFGVKLVVLALPSASKIKRKRVIESLILLPVRVVTVPTFEDSIEGKQQSTQTEDIAVEDLLGRDTVPPLAQYMKACTQGKVCLVTGAGGSIGSELCRQIAACHPVRIILLDVSEPALFGIEQDLLQNHFNDISCYLGSVTDSELLNRVFTEHQIDSVFHAAAYKHVPMVEANPMAGLINNVEGTKTLLAAAQRSKCASFTLISTDKAVRPTNVMGATKRLAEMVCQLAAESKTNATTISMVRFGNVLGSSGSVIPTFQKQIMRGGPVTLTHPGITRYFMSIPEAAQLVIQSAGMAEGGDVFLLDMGTPIKIYDLAERLIRLSGKSVRLEEDNSEPGSIAIKVTGLRPGEKLYEELLVDADALTTHHVKIMRARESCVSAEMLEEGLKDLVAALHAADIAKFRTKLATLVNGYQPSETEA